MILFPPKKRVTDKALAGYLLGSLRQDETERLDELSIVDGDFAARLDAVENDLVDAYVRGKLSGDTLQRFRVQYLATDIRREKVRFAESLYLFEGKHFTQATPNGELARGHDSPSLSSPSLFSPSAWRLFAFQPWIAAGALAMLLAISLLFINNLQLRNRMTQANADREALLQRERDLQGKLDQVHASDAKVATELAQVQKSLAELEQASSHRNPASSFSPLGVVAFTLTPPLRGAAPMPQLSLPPGTTRVDLHLDLESNDYPQYQVALKSLRADQIVWHSGKLKAETKGQGSAVSVSVPAALLKPETYQLELTGSPSSGEPQLVSTYVFRIGSS
jgi:hypothetical protein